MDSQSVPLSSLSEYTGYTLSVVRLADVQLGVLEAGVAVLCVMAAEVV